MKSAGIIPSRYASSRFPGKPLAKIGHKTMLQRVYEKARLSELDEVVIATDDQRIAEHAESIGAPVIMTSPDLANGTLRCHQTLALMDNDPDIVVNIQGDEPFIRPDQINALLNTFNDQSVNIATLAHHFESLEELEMNTTMKIVTDHNGNALYFSRSVIPYIRDEQKENWLRAYPYLKHIGIYAFRTAVFNKITSLPEAPPEIAESLEQLRWLYHGYNIRVVETQYHGMSVDTPEDLERANYFLNTLYE